MNFPYASLPNQAEFFEATTRLAECPFEHNARRQALCELARVENDGILAWHAKLIRPLRADGSAMSYGVCPNTKFAARAEVYGINASLAEAYATQHNTAMYRSIEATSHAAFEAWDAARLQAAA
jgi:hypothetical protein